MYIYLDLESFSIVDILSQKDNQEKKEFEPVYCAQKMDKRNPNIHYYVKQWQILNHVFNVWCDFLLSFASRR